MGRAKLTVARVGHAGVVISTPQVRCLMDPILVHPHSCIELCPPVRIRREQLAGQVDAVVLSHEHPDHFSIASLDWLDRSCHLYYPHGAELIAMCVERLGFERSTAVRPWEEIDLGGLTLIPTPSQVPFPEIGALFQAEGKVVFNMVDTFTHAGIAQRILERVGGVDLLLARHSPTIESANSVDALGASFPADSYVSMLQNVVELAPRCVIPTAHGYIYGPDAAWLNQRAFPMTQDQFLRDVRSLRPEIVTRLLAPGDAIEVGEDFETLPAWLPYVERLDDALCPPDLWRPDLGVPPLEDRGPGETESLRQVVARYLEGPFLAGSEAPAQEAWRARMRRLGLVWRLRVVYPSGPDESRLLDFTREPLRWSEDDPRVFAKICTSVTGSGVVGLLTGARHLYDVALTSLRTSYRLYNPAQREPSIFESCGEDVVGLLLDEPLLRVLHVEAERRYCEAELRKLGR
jgi:L-ascorbate metabolism protein UlaG (beta-lactamase superfamily)